jgi:23S rRNA (cytosine1962-C5)-methyltransferase
MTEKKTRSPSTPHRPSQGNRDFRNRTKRSTKAVDSQSTRSKVQYGEAGAPPCIILKAGREKSLLRRHPWIFSGAIERVDGAPASGDTLPVRDDAGNFLAWAAYNPDRKSARGSGLCVKYKISTRDSSARKLSPRWRRAAG